MSPDEAEAPVAAVRQAAAGGSASGEAASASAERASRLELELDDLQPAGGCRVSEELHPVSLTDLFATDPECAAKAPERKLAGGLARSMAFAGAGIDDELELKKLQVFVRIRPSVTSGAPAPKGASAADLARENCVHATSRHSIAIAPPEGSQAYRSGDRGQTYSFTRVFDRDTPQEEYYECTAAPLVRDLLRNPSHNSVMLAYGITAAGKTYTIEGTRERPGVLPRALMALFQGLQSHAEPVVARAAYYEVYNEQIYDLLDEQGVGPLGQRAPLRLKEDSLGRVFVAGLAEVEVGSADKALLLLRRGSRQRQRAETGLNYSSSRSHSIFTVTLYQLGLDAQSSEEGADGVPEEGDGRSGEQKLGHMSFVDLAGSERAQRTGNVGVRLKESVAINSSLMTLGRCLEALRWNQQHKGGGNLRVVPYRESKVTHLFRDALHGWGQVVLSVNVSPVARDYDETAHVLKYAALATQIGTIQQAEAPRRTIKAVSPAIRKVKRKAALPPEARRQGGGGGGKAKRAKKDGAPAAAPAATAYPAAESAADGEAVEAQPDAEDDLEAATASDQQQEAAVAEQDCAACDSPEADYDLQAGTPGDDADAAGLQGDCACTPTTPADAEEEAAAALQVQVQQLIGDLQKAEERCVLLEAEVREEVADEMAQLLRDMEESYRLRLEAEVEALEKKMAAEPAGKRGRGRGGKATAKPEQVAEASAEDLAAARAEAAEAAERADQLQEQVEGLQRQLTEVQAQAEQQAAGAAEHAAGLAAQLAEAQQRRADAEASLSAQQQRCAALAAELAAAQQAAQAELGAAQQQLDVLQRELAAAQQEGSRARAELAATNEQLRQAQTKGEAAQQEAEELGAQAAAAQQQVAELGAELAAARQKVADLDAELATALEAADSKHRRASQQYEAQLQEAVTQLEANKSMELEMAEEQCERLRKENLTLKARLHAALAALAACGSPVAGPAALAMRMAQACPEGNGRGAGGTPHDVALARARQAAAAEDMAAAGGPAGLAAAGPAGPRGRSRFAEQAEAIGSEHPAAPAPAGGRAAEPPIPNEAAADVAPTGQADQQQQQHGTAAQPAPRRRGRAKKAVAFAGIPEDQETVPPMQPEQPSAQQQEQEEGDALPGAAQPAVESRRARRMTRAAAMLQLHSSRADQRGQELGQEQPRQQEAQQAQQPELQEPQAEAAPAAKPVKERRGRRRTQAPAAGEALAATADAKTAGRSACLLPALQPVVLLLQHGEEPPPQTAALIARKARPAAVSAAGKENAADVAAAAAAGSGKLASNSEGAPAAALAALPAQPAEQQVAGKASSKRRKRLLPNAPLSADMRAELGDPEGGSLRQRVTAKKALAARQAATAPDAAAEEGGRRRRRQTQFYRL
ncbi:hypothetical protein ABPG77_004007 [Micractinium sp. CCAP 211/92]